MKNQITGRLRVRTALRVLRTSVAGAVLAFTAVVVQVPVSHAATVPCDSSALVSAVAAVASSGGTVTLTAGCTYTLNTVTNTLDGPSAFATIVAGVTIVGNGATIARSSDSLTADFRFFIIDSNGDLTLNNLTLSNGSIPTGEVHGGGAIINRDHLTVTGVSFLKNRSMGGSGGGAIDNHDLGVLSVSNSIFDSNGALQGGAIEDEATLCHASIPLCGNATVTNSTFSNNSTTNFGGGAFESQLDTTTTGSPPICGTQPASSVPVECQEVGGAHDTLTGDTFTGNTATGEGGGIANFGTTTVVNSTITGNTAGTAGGGGVQNTGTFTVTDSTIAGNSSAFGADIHVYTDLTHQPGQTTVTMSIVAAGSTANCSFGAGAPAISDGGYNIDSGSSCGFSSVNHSMSVIDPKLTPLASNGGPTQTMALQGTSPAIDAGPATCTPNTDQRGAPRPQGPACDIGAFEVYTVPPTIPTGLAASANGGHEIDLSWVGSTSPIGVAGYDISRGGTKIATVSGTTLSYADKGLADATTYTYTVDSFDAVGNTSNQSTQASATTPDVTAPSIPTGIAANAVGGHEIDLSWSPSTDNVGVTGYDIYRNGSSTPLATVSGSTLTYADKAVSDATTYTYTVDAFDAAGNHSAQSSSVSATTPDVTPPSVPTGLSATVSSSEVDLSWNASTDNVGVTGYDIYRNGTKIAQVGGATTTYADTTVVQGASYSYTVDAFDAAGNHSAQSSPATVNTPDVTPPTVPSGLAATTTTKPSVTLTWNASTDNVGVTGYDIYRGGTLLATVSGTTLTYTDNSVVQLTNYSYAVDAFDAAGNHSAKSTAIVVGTPDSTPPSTPTGLTATATTVPSVVLKWNASTDNVGVTGYTIYRNGSQLTTVSGSTLTYTDSAVNQTTAYTYAIDAFDAAGNHSAQSASVPVLTSTELYFAWYDNASPGVNAETIHITNPNGTTAVGTISLTGAATLSFSVPSGQDRYYTFPHGTIGGPVLISSMSGRVVASLRSWYYQSFNETPGRTAKDAATTLYLPWYDLSSPGMYADTIHITNPGQTAATGTISMAGATPININVGPGQDSYYEFPGGTIGGPVTISASVPVLAALRAWYYQSFNETMARPESSAATSQYFPWYDLQSPGMRADTIHITNESGVTATGSISLPGAPSISFTVPSGRDSFFAFPGGTIGGPVTISSSTPVLASLRAWYYQSFNETAAHPAAAAATTQYFPWYDLSSPGMQADTIHITNESGTTATGTITVPGAAPITFTVLSGHDLYLEFPAGTIGGPVTITSSQPVIASLRAWYYQSFNEVPASP